MISPHRLPSLWALALDRATLLIAAAAMMIAVLAPCADAWGASAFGAQLRAVLEKSCHHDPAKCWHLLGAPLALCARCTGLYLGVLLGRALYHAGDWSAPRMRAPALRALWSPALWLALMAVMVADWWLTGHGILPRSLPRAALTGLLFGIGWMVGPHRLLLQLTRRVLGLLNA